MNPKFRAVLFLIHAEGVFTSTVSYRFLSLWKVWENSCRKVFPREGGFHSKKQLGRSWGERPGPDLNRRITVLQTAALPLGYQAGFLFVNQLHILPLRINHVPCLFHMHMNNISLL